MLLKLKQMKKTILVIITILFSIPVISQQRIDGNFAFQIDPAKKYSLYIPSSYNSSIPTKMMLALHPYNTSRWNAVSWCDTLINFAESNNLILVCPDGGVDGKIDDPIDTAFTSTLLDSARIWYNIDNNKTYVMGFSWGGKTTYTYGLNRPTVFGGYLPIGAAISGTSEVTIPLQLKSVGKPVYIIHGSSDSPTSRFYPVRDSLISKGALVKTNLLSGVGHTIDFSNRDAILTAGFQWIDSVNCYQLTVNISTMKNKLLPYSFFPNPVHRGYPLKIDVSLKVEHQMAEITIFTLQGKKVTAFRQTIHTGINSFNKAFTHLPVGTYIISIQLNDKKIISQKITIK